MMQEDAQQQRERLAQSDVQRAPYADDPEDLYGTGGAQGSGSKVWPVQDEKFAVEMRDRRESPVTPWSRAQLVLVVLALVAVTAGIIVACVCGIRGCPARQADTSQESTQPLRLVLQFRDLTIDAADLVPAVLRPYVARLKLDSSLLQVLDFATEDVLQEVRAHLVQNGSLAWLVRDYSMSLGLRAVAQSQLGSLQPPRTLNDSAVAALAPYDDGQDAGQQPDASNSTSAAQQVPANDTGVAQASADLPAGSRRHLAQTAASVTVNDPLVMKGWQWYHARIKTLSAWSSAAAAGASGSGTPPVIVAVIDTGFDLTHPDLASRLWTNKGEVPNNGIDDDGNGFVDDYQGFGFSSKAQTDDWGTHCVDDPSPAASASDDQHGTHVAGLVGAAFNNSLGGTGMTANVQLMLLKVTTCEGLTTAATIVRALDYAVRMGAHIVSLSFADEFADLQPLGGGLPTQPTTPPDDATAQAYQDRQTMFTTALKPLADRGTLAVVAAGNYGLNVDALLKLKYTNAPCTVQLPNVLCVGASTNRDTRAPFSNYGAAQVDVSAPGDNNIWSTWGTFSSSTVQHVYAALNGTSQATPITSGTCALITSVLGAIDKNYQRAEQVKQLLLDGGDATSALVGTSVSGRRINALTSVQLAISRRQSYSTSALSLGPFASATTTSALMSALGSRALTRGFTEAYWTNRGAPPLLDTAGQRLLDQTVRDAGVGWTNWANVQTSTAGGVLVVMSCQVLLSTAGLHTFNVSYLNVAQRQSRVFVGDRGLTPFGGISSFYASAPGWYKVAVLLLPGSSSTSVSVTLATPASGGTVSARPMALNGGSYTVVAGTDALDVPGTPAQVTNFTDPAMPYVWGFSPGFAVSFNRSTTSVVDSTARSLHAMSLNLTASENWWQIQTSVADLNIPSGMMRATLLTSADASTALYGVATAYMDTTGMPSQITLQVSCQVCRVTLDGVVVLDARGSTASPSTPTTRSSSCITISPGATRSKTYRLDVFWAARNVSTAALALKWAGCGAGGLAPLNAVSGQQRASRSPAVISLGSTQAPKLLGWVSGVQCDVWSVGSASGTTVPSSPPLYRVRLPACPSPEYPNSKCSTPWSFTINSLVPGGPVPLVWTSFYTVRCWTYTNATLPANLAGSTGTDASGIPTSVSLGGVQLYAADVSGVTFQAPVAADYRYGKELHLLSVVWAGIWPTTTLSLLGNGKPINITTAAYRLPLWTVPSPDSRLNWGSNICTSRVDVSTTSCDPLIGYNPLATPGMTIKVVSSSSADVAGVVPNDITQVDSGSTLTFSSGTQALSSSSGTWSSMAVTFSSTPTQAWYAQTDGYVTIDSTAGGWVSLSSDEPAGTATLVLVGDVVLRNAPVFNARSAALTGQSVTVWLPPQCYLKFRLVTKLKALTSPLGSVQYNWKIRAPSTAALAPISIPLWHRAT